MALTSTQLASVLRQEDDEVISRLLVAAVATIERYALSAPDEVKDEAAIRFCSHLLHPGRDRIRSFRVANISFDFTASATAFRASGAMALVAPWRVHRAGAC